MKNTLFLTTLSIGFLALAAGCTVDDKMMRDEARAAANTVSTSQGTNAAESACMSAVNSEYGGNVRDLSVANSEFSQAGSLIMVDADGERWRCLASNDGQIEELSRAGGGAANNRQAANPAESACLAAVAKETNNNDVTILNSEFSEANSLVMIGVGAERAPWRCLVSNDGVVAEVMFSGDEGKL